MLDIQKHKVASLSVLITLVTSLWFLLGWDREPRDPAKAAAYWFGRYVGIAVHRRDPFASVNAQPVIQGLQRVGTNAVPYLLAQAFNGQEYSPLFAKLQKYCDTIGQRVGIDVPLPRNVSQGEVREYATHLIFELRPRSDLLVPALIGALSGTNQLAKVQAIQLLGSAGSSDDRVIELLVKYSSDSDPSVRQEAFRALRNYLFKVEPALPRFIAALSTADLNARPTEWVKDVGFLLRDAGPKAKAAAPYLLEWLSSQAVDVEDNSAFLYVLSALIAIQPENPDVVPLLKVAFGLPTDWQDHFRLATQLLETDPRQSQAVSFLTNAWVCEIDGSRWMQVSNSLERLHFDMRQLPEPVRFRPAPLAQWLALGRDAQPCSLAPALQHWTALLGTKEPEYQGRTLRQWLLDPDPARRYAALETPWAGLMDQARAAMHASGREGIAWLLTRLKAPNRGNMMLARRGFALLGEKGLIALPALVELAQARDADIREAAYVCLNRIKPDWATLWPLLVPALHDPDLGLRLDTAQFLCKEFPEQARQAGVDQCLPLALRPTNLSFPVGPVAIRKYQ